MKKFTKTFLYISRGVCYTFQGEHVQFTNFRRGQVFSALGYEIVPPPDSVQILEKKKNNLVGRVLAFAQFPPLTWANIIPV